ncbi:MAG TPA: histidine kinase [Terriglobales bacterium]|nr:histidine kinase [Terriglobales bacterium]
MVLDPTPLPLIEIAEQARREVDLLTREMGEIEGLVQQARNEAAHHEAKRSQTLDKLKTSSGYDTEGEQGQQTAQLMALTRRSAIMESQVDVLEGKLKVLTRFKESLRRYSAELDRASMGGAVPYHASDKLDTNAPLPPAVSRLVLAAQEDLRREIARAMHDGPAQSLTNIVLQAQIVERLLDRDPSQLKAEIGQLVGMVQHTLEATKAFIFDVRPMVLDDLGLVPTLRRVARDRGRRSQTPIEFESYGTDRRLPMDVESAFFRIIDETVTGFISCHPDRISIRLEWAADKTEARISARREVVEDADEPAVDESLPSDKRAKGQDREIPAALKLMIDETRAAKVVRAARANQPMALPPNTWREVQQRADTIGAAAELVDQGRAVVLVLLAS